MTKLYIGNLPYSVRNESLQSLFSQFGTVLSASVILERDTGRSKGFGFVEFEDDAAANTAIAEMNGKELEGRKILVSVAKPMTPSPRGGGFRGGSRGFRG